MNESCNQLVQLQMNADAASSGLHSVHVCVQVYDDMMFAEEELSDMAEEECDSDNPDEEGHCTHEYPDELSTNDEAGSSGGGEGSSLDSNAEDSAERDMW